jgi:hypothetical protein
MTLSVFHQAGTQLDRALWCFRDDPVTCLWLSLPSAIGVAAAVALPALLLATPNAGELVPLLLPWVSVAMLGLTFAGVPFAHYAFARVQGERPGAGLCFRRSFGRVGALTKLAFQLSWRYLGANLLAGLPWFYLAPKMGLAVQVTLFEREANSLPRCQKLLRDTPHTITLLALLHLGMLAALLALSLVSWLVVALLTKEGEPEMAGSSVFLAAQIAWGWIALVLVLSSWTLSLTFLYTELRAVREGAGLWARLDRLRVDRFPASVAAARPSP